MTGSPEILGRARGRSQGRLTRPAARSALAWPKMAPSTISPPTTVTSGGASASTTHASRIENGVSLEPSSPASAAGISRTPSVHSTSDTANTSPKNTSSGNLSAATSRGSATTSATANSSTPAEPSASTASAPSKRRISTISRASMNASTTARRLPSRSPGPRFPATVRVTPATATAAATTVERRRRSRRISHASPAARNGTVAEITVTLATSVRCSASMYRIIDSAAGTSSSRPCGLRVARIRRPGWGLPTRLLAHT